MTWTFPIEISVRAPLLRPPLPAPDLSPPGPRPSEPREGAERRRARRSSSLDRGGYKPGFIPGFVVPLPKLDGVSYELAPNRRAGPGDDPFELRYHHFSIVVNAERRLAAVTACNIDGGRVVAVNRSDKTTNMTPRLTDLGVESSGRKLPMISSLTHACSTGTRWPSSSTATRTFRVSRSPRFPAATRHPKNDAPTRGP